MARAWEVIKEGYHTLPEAIKHEHFDNRNEDVNKNILEQAVL